MGEVLVCKPASTPGSLTIGLECFVVLGFATLAVHDVTLRASLKIFTNSRLILPFLIENSYQSNFVHNGSGSHGVNESRFFGILAQHLAHRSFILRGTVPFEVGKLMLALSDAFE